MHVFQSKVKMELGKYEQARAQARKGLEVAREIRSRRNIGYTLCVLGSVALVEGAYAEAQRLLQESIDTYREIGMPDETSRWKCVETSRIIKNPVMVVPKLDEFFEVVP